MLDLLSSYASSSPVVAGCTMLLMNLGSKYIVMDIPKGMDSLFSHPWVRKLTIFAVAFMATKNLKTSIMLLLLFLLFSRFLFNEKSMFCIPHVKENVKNQENQVKMKKK
jgi:hypothetical protein